jgi:predicted nucleic acid-binding protein
LRDGSSGTIRSHQASGIRQSRRVVSGSSCISEAPRGEHCSLEDTLKVAYWDSLLAVLEARGTQEIFLEEVMQEGLDAVREVLGV